MIDSLQTVDPSYQRGGTIGMLKQWINEDLVSVEDLIGLRKEWAEEELKCPLMVKQLRYNAETIDSMIEGLRDKLTYAQQAVGVEYEPCKRWGGEFTEAMMVVLLSDEDRIAISTNMKGIEFIDSQSFVEGFAYREELKTLRLYMIKSVIDGTKMNYEAMELVIREAWSSLARAAPIDLVAVQLRSEVDKVAMDSDNALYTLALNASKRIFNNLIKDTEEC